MSVATLYDVHGNLPALDTVLKEVPGDAAIVVGGDVAGPFPQETVDRLRGLGNRVAWIRGNADRELQERGLAPPAVLDWVRSRLTPEAIEWLYALPPTLVLEQVLYCHDEPHGASWRLDLESGYTPYELDVGELPFEWPSLSRAAAVAHFETRAVGA